MTRHIYLLIIPILLLTPTVAMAIHVESGNTTCDYPDVFGSEYSGQCLPVTHEGRLVATSGPGHCYNNGTCDSGGWIPTQNQTR
jgi:hypothetical protein